MPPFLRPAAAAPRAILLLTLAAVALCGCAAGPAHLALKHPSAAASARTPAAPALGVRFTLLPVVDGRGSGAGAGMLTGRLVTAVDALRWCQAALDTLLSPLAAPRETEAPTVELAPILRKLHVEDLSTSKAATIVIEVEFRRLNQPPARRIYRGRQVAINWFSSAIEIEAAFNAALQRCMAALSADLQNGTWDSPSTR